MWAHGAWRNENRSPFPTIPLGIRPHQPDTQTKPTTAYGNANAIHAATGGVPHCDFAALERFGPIGSQTSRTGVNAGLPEASLPLSHEVVEGGAGTPPSREVPSYYAVLIQTTFTRIVALPLPTPIAGVLDFGDC
jgi:hypothetical protein